MHNCGKHLAKKIAINFIFVIFIGILSKVFYTEPSSFINLTLKLVYNFVHYRQYMEVLSNQRSAAFFFNACYSELPGSHELKT